MNTADNYKSILIHKNPTGDCFTGFKVGMDLLPVNAEDFEQNNETAEMIQQLQSPVLLQVNEQKNRELREGQAEAQAAGKRTKGEGGCAL